MPYICLARNDIPDGTLQVLDLWPNTSRRNQSIDPPGQTRYVNRTESNPVAVDINTGLVSAGTGYRASTGSLRGLDAYLADRVEPGGTAQSTVTVTCTGVQVGDTVTINGQAFTAVAGAPGAQQFDQSGGDNATATSLVATITSNASIDLMRVGPQANVYADAAAALNVVTLTAMFDPDAAGAGTAAVNQLGPDGDIAVISSNAVRLALSNAFGRMARTNEAWTEALLTNTAAAIQARVDAGQSLALADIVALLPNTDLGALSNSSATVLEILSILAGRGFGLPTSSLKFTAAVVPDQIHVWNVARLGSFDDSVQVFDARMLGGEITSQAPYTKFKNISSRSQTNNVKGGDAGVDVPIKGVRYNVDGDSMQVSLQAGHLSRMQDGSVTLFPDSIYSAFKGGASFAQPGPQTGEVNSARLVTVYDNDGSLL